MLVLYKKSIFIIMLVCLLSPLPIKSMEKKWFGPKAQLGISLMAAGLANSVMYAARDSSALQSVGNVLNLDYAEMQTSMAVTGGLFGLALLGNKKISKAASSVAWRVPFYTLLIAGIYSKNFEYMISVVPFVGGALSQNNKVAKAFVLLAAGVGAYNVLNKVEDKIKKRFFPSQSSN